MSWEEQVKALINGETKSDRMLVVGRTPTILREIGLSDLPLMMDQNHVLKLRQGTTSSTNDDHILSWKTIQKLPELIANPVAVMLSQDDKYRNTTVNVIVAAESKTGKQVFSAIELDTQAKERNERIDINKVATVFGATKFCECSMMQY